VETCERQFGGLDILVNNAGIVNMKGLEQTSEEEWDAIVNVNQKGVWLGMKTAVPAMRKRGGGSIINISSIYGLIGSAGATAYHGTKGAVRLLTKAAAVQYAPEKIRVNSIQSKMAIFAKKKAIFWFSARSWLGKRGLHFHAMRRRVRRSSVASGRSQTVPCARA
jgi:NAD(P)-dependent dehydrogenase (short-subunit alcohol dehydrogenase family)